eukprot:3916398-Rhodomonas_salina.1
MPRPCQGQSIAEALPRRRRRRGEREVAEVEESRVEIGPSPGPRREVTEVRGKSRGVDWAERKGESSRQSRQSRRGEVEKESTEVEREVERRSPGVEKEEMRERKSGRSMGERKEIDCGEEEELKRRSQVEGETKRLTVEETRREERPRSQWRE